MQACSQQDIQLFSGSAFQTVMHPAGHPISQLDGPNRPTDIYMLYVYVYICGHMNAWAGPGALADWMKGLLSRWLRAWTLE